MVNKTDYMEVSVPKWPIHCSVGVEWLVTLTVLPLTGVDDDVRTK